MTGVRGGEGMISLSLSFCEVAFERCERWRRHGFPLMLSFLGCIESCERWRWHRFLDALKYMRGGYVIDLSLSLFL
jgi:hypothetical protein